MDRDGAPSSSHRFRIVHVYKPKSSIYDNTQGQSHFVKRSSLDSRYVINNSTMVITCGVKVLRDEPISVPPSNILSHLGGLLDSADGSDVSFVVDGEEFAAHRAVLIARSPVFKAQLLGSMADAKMTSTTLQDIAPATFRVMLRYMYTDEFPEDAELVTEKLQDLFVAADRFALDRLKLFCAGKLWIEVSVDTVGAALAWAETYNCPELKKKCIDFLADEKNFRKVVLTDGFIQMVQKFPSVLAELRVKVAA
nr:unnamed protein product [Digitaria exilis]